MARPTVYSVEVAERICERLAAGESLRTICAGKDSPGERTIYRWLQTIEEFRQQYAPGARPYSGELSSHSFERFGQRTPPIHTLRDFLRQRGKRLRQRFRHVIDAKLSSHLLIGKPADIAAAAALEALLISKLPIPHILPGQQLDAAPPAKPGTTARGCAPRTLDLRRKSSPQVSDQ